MITVTIPLKTVTESNAKEHWRTKARRAKGQRDASGLTIAAELHQCGLRDGKSRLPLTVLLTRLAPGTLDDDNNVSAAKHVRDGVADALGIDDRDPRVTWLYAQEKAKGYAVRITITRREA